MKRTPTEADALDLGLEEVASLIAGVEELQVCVEERKGRYG